MTDKVFLIGLGGAGTEIVRNIQATKHDLFVYRCLDVTLNGSVTEENHDPAWAKFFDPSIPAFNLFYNFRQMTSDRLKDPSVLYSSLEKNCQKYSSDYQVALISGLGQTIGATSILTFAAALSHNTRLNQPSSINCAAFGTTPFDFEGENIKKISQETIAGLRNILPEAKIRILNNQDLMLGSRDLTSSDGNIILHNAVKN